MEISLKVSVIKIREYRQMGDPGRGSTWRTDRWAILEVRVFTDRQMGEPGRRCILCQMPVNKVCIFELKIEITMAVNVKITVFCDVTPCILVTECLCFRVTFQFSSFCQYSPVGFDSGTCCCTMYPRGSRYKIIDEDLCWYDRGLGMQVGTSGSPTLCQRHLLRSVSFCSPIHPKVSQIIPVTQAKLTKTD